MRDSTEKKSYLEHLNPERREFIKKIAKGAFIIPAVVSVSMLDQKLHISAAMARSGNGT